jgi:putative flavoprotein involved in K+ transport
MTTCGQNANGPSEPLIESGEAFRRLSGLHSAKRERFDVIVIGGGQAGLSVGYHLRQRGLRFLILDGSDRIGDAWRKRWDSLRLFTPAKLDGLAGMKFPAAPDYFPTKDEMADYLEAYAARFQLPVQTRARVDRLFKRDGAFVVKTGDRELTADQVVVAMASYQERHVPAFARDLRPDIVQLHSSEYRQPGQLRPGGVLIAGAGNSGAEIAAELARDRRVLLAGRPPGEVPFRIGGWFARKLAMPLLLRVIFHRILTVKTPMGRKARPRFTTRGTPLIRIKSRDLVAAGVERVARISGARDGLPVTEDGRVLDVANVVWSTGFHPGFSWIDLALPRSPEGHGEPIHDGGLVLAAPGLYFVGLHFLYAVSSTMIHGVGRDAERIARAIQAQHAASARA